MRAIKIHENRVDLLRMTGQLEILLPPQEPDLQVSLSLFRVIMIYSHTD